MRVSILAIAASAMLTGCLWGGPVAVVDERGPYWDGRAYVTVTEHTHCVGCGHYYYDNGWNLYPANHVYVQAGYARHGDHHARSDHGNHGSAKHDD